MKISEITTVDKIMQPTELQKKHIANFATIHYIDNLYYAKDGDNITVVAKDGDIILGYVVGIAYHNPLFKDIPKFVVPKNLFSWANDSGITALSLIKAVIKLSEIPVLSDIELTNASKRFLKKQINLGNLRAQTFDLNTGNVTTYNDNLWEIDDDHRVILLDQKFGRQVSKLSVPIMEVTWNYVTNNRRLKAQ